MVDELRATFTGVLDAMSVDPVLEWTRDLDVLKLHAIDEAAMERLPPKLQRTAPISIVSRLPSAMPPYRDIREVLPRRGQTLERARPHVPGKKRRGIDIEDGVFLVGGHDVSRLGRRGCLAAPVTYCATVVFFHRREYRRGSRRPRATDPGYFAQSDCLRRRRGRAPTTSGAHELEERSPPNPRNVPYGTVS